jgi:hypothetical protein
VSSGIVSGRWRPDFSVIWDEHFNARRMAEDYIEKYKKVTSGASLSLTRPQQSPSNSLIT